MSRPTTSRLASMRGFTIIELMVAIAIVAILATLAGPSMTDLIERRRLASQTEAITDLLQIARSEAIKHSGTALPREVAATISPTTNPWFIGLRNGNAACDGHAGASPCVLSDGRNEVLRFVAPFSPDPEIEMPTTCKGCSIVEPAAREVIVFSFRGMVEAGGTDQAIVLESPRGYRTRITLSRIGRVSVCTPTPGMTGYKPC